MPENTNCTTADMVIEAELCPSVTAGKNGHDSLIGSSSETLDLKEPFLIVEPTCAPMNAEPPEEPLGQEPEPEKGKDGLVIVDQEKELAKPTCLQSSFGVILGLTSGLANSLVALLVKLINSIGTFEIAVFRYVVMLVPLITTLIWRRTNPFTIDLIKRRGWVLVLRAIVGAASTYCKYFALHKLPLADASVILFSSPVFASILARIFLKEKFHWVHAVAITVTLGGCMLVSRPTFIFGSAAYNPNLEWDDHMWGCLAALTSAVFSASVFVTVRHMKDVESTIVLFWTAFVGLIISLVATTALDYFKFPTDPWEITYIIGVGILTLISQEALTRALKRESAGVISLLRTGDIVWAFIWQVTLFRVIPHMFSIIGAMLVVICVIFVSLREAADKMPADSKLGIAIRRMNKSVESISCRNPCLRRRRSHQEPAETFQPIVVT